MRKLLFRFVLIAAFVYLLLDINDSPDYNYTTKIKSTITNIEIDIPEVASGIYKKSVEWGSVLTKIGEDILQEFGVETQKGN